MTGRRKSARASAERGKQARSVEEDERNARENQPAVSVRRLQLPHPDVRVFHAAQRAEETERHAKENRERSAEDKAEPKAQRNQVPNTEDKQARNAEEKQERSVGGNQAPNAKGKQARNSDEKRESNAEDNPETSAEDNQAQNAEAKQERNAEEKQESNAEDNPETSAEDNQARDAEAKQERNAEEKQESNAEDDPETSAEDNQAQNAEAKQERNAEEKQESNAEDNPETSAEDKQEQNASEEREASAGEREASAEEREASAGEREASAEEREASAGEREGCAGEREASAEEREASAEEREASAEEREASAGEREASAEQRKASAEEREASAEDREASAEEREASAEEREASAEEREASAEEREVSADEREASADEQDSESLQKELSESSESDEMSVQSRADISDDTDEKENGDTFPSEEKENQCPDVSVKEYRCKYCAFTTLHLGDFKEHVDSAHPDVILNPLYLCVACNFTTKKFESLTAHNEEQHPRHASFSFRKSRSADRTVLEQTIDASDSSLPSAYDGRREDVHALSVNGTVILPDASVLHDSAHVSPMLQRPPNFSCLPQIAVPLNTTKYNPSLDDNATLIASFSRFPYPTHAELSWLTAASKHPEEQIRVWFTTQRLKQGITWAPEEVEEARKKMFNGSVPAPHGTLPVSKATARTTTVEPPKQASPRNALKRTSTASFGLEPKRPVMAVAPNPGEKGLMAPPPLPLKPTLDAKRAPVPFAPLMLQKPSPNSLKTWPIVPMPSMVFPESLTRRTITPAPFYSPQFKSNVLVPRPSDKTAISLPNGALPNSAPLIPPQIRRPAVIQALRGNAEQTEPLDDPKSDVQQRVQVLTQFPLLERLKGKTAEQLKLLEESFLRNSFPTLSDMETLAATTRLSPAEVDSWFSERRALRDNLEQALLNSMGNRRNGPSHAPNGHSHAPNGPSHAPNGPSHAPNGPSVFITNGHPPNGHALNSHNSHAHNGHGLNGHAHNGHAPNSHNGHTPNGYSSHAPNAPGPMEKMLQNGVHRAVPSRGPEELAVSRWSFVDDLTQRWFNADISGKTGSVLQSPELIGSRCLDSTNGRAQEAEPNWFKPSYERYNRMDLGPMFGRWTDRRQDLSEES